MDDNVLNKLRLHHTKVVIYNYRQIKIHFSHKITSAFHFL